MPSLFVIEPWYVRVKSSSDSIRGFQGEGPVVRDRNDDYYSSYEVYSRWNQSNATKYPNLLSMYFFFDPKLAIECSSPIEKGRWGRVSMRQLRIYARLCCAGAPV